jgi:hypothetical protein
MTRRFRKMLLLRRVLARAVASRTGSIAIDLPGEAVVVATTTMIGIITGGGAIGSGARVQTVLESRRLVLLIAEVVGVIQTDTDRERGATEVVLQARGSTTAIRIERGNQVKIRRRRNVDVKETNHGSTGTLLGLPMPLTQIPTKIELRRTFTFYRKALTIPLHYCPLCAHPYLLSVSLESPRLRSSDVW